MQGSARKDVVFGAARVYIVTVPGPKWKSWLRQGFGLRSALERPVGKNQNNLREKIARRTFLGGLTGALLANAAAPRTEQGPRARAITRGPRFHWFGYYDKFQFDPANRYALGVWNTFEHRSPTANDKLGIGMVDLEDHDRWIEIGETRAWNWHRTCNLQWLPGSESEILFNDREGDRFVCRILDVKTKKKRTLPGPVSSVSPDGKWAVAMDYKRLFDIKPETGYAGLEDPYEGISAPDQIGIWHMDMASGKRELIISFADMAAVPFEHGDWTGGVHSCNHLLISPDSKRFVFLHKRNVPGQRPGSRMFTADPDGGNLHLVEPYGKTSHFIWRDSQNLLLWAWHPSHEWAYYIFRDRSDHVEAVDPEVLTRNGHCTYLPGNRWILTDTGPDDKRMQEVYIYDTRTRGKVSLGFYHTPPEYRGEWRCDTTPRYSRDGRKVIFDSPHGGNGRQMYLADIGPIIDQA